MKYRPPPRDRIMIEVTPDRKIEPTHEYQGHTYKMIRARVTSHLGVQAMYKRIR